MEKREISISTNAAVREQMDSGRCGREVSMLSVTLTERLAGVPERMVCRWVEAGSATF